jgi:hypothetical protein
MPVVRHVKSEINWKTFSGDSVIVPICVRSPNVQGRNFVSMLEAISERVKNVHVVMCDYLDRYNLNMDAELAMKQSHDWKSEYLPEVKNIFPYYDLTDWLEIMAHPTFDSRYDEIQKLYKFNSDVKSAVDINVDHYVFPKMERIIQEQGWDADFNINEMNHTSRAYLLEEYAGTAIYKELVPSQTQVYWGVYIDDTDVFNRHSDTDLRLPTTLPVINNRLGNSIVSIGQNNIRRVA